MTSQGNKGLRIMSLGLCLLTLSTLAGAQDPPEARGSFARTLGPAWNPYGLNGSGVATLSNGVVVTVFECERVSRHSVKPFCLLLSRDGRVLKRVQTLFRPARRGDYGVYFLSPSGHVDVAVDSRDRIVVAGYAESDGEWGPVVARWLPSGRLDRSFGRRGVVHLPVGTWTGAVAVDAQDGIVVGGRAFLNLNPDPLPSNFGVRLHRLRSDGSVDTAFGDSGAAIVDFSDLGTFVDGHTGVRIRVDAQGRTTVATLARDMHLISDATEAVASARLLSDGTLDASFGLGGRVVHAFVAQVIPGCPNPWYFFPLDVALDPAGRVLVAVKSIEPADDTAVGDVGVVALGPGGGLDPAFGVGGLARFHLPLLYGGMAVQPDGKIVLGGSRDRNFGHQPLKGSFMAVRILADGSALDPAFGDAGVAEGYVISSVENVHAANGEVVVTPEGTVLVTGLLEPGDRLSRHCSVPPSPRLYVCGAVKAFDTNGVPEPSLEDQRRR